MKIQYNGSQSARVIVKGDTLNGQYPRGIPYPLTFDISNDWTIDTASYPWLNAALTTVILAMPGSEFINVTSTPNQQSPAQKIFQTLSTSPIRVLYTGTGPDNGWPARPSIIAGMVEYVSATANVTAPAQAMTGDTILIPTA